MGLFNLFKNKKDLLGLSLNLNQNYDVDQY